MGPDSGAKAWDKWTVVRAKYPATSTDCDKLYFMSTAKHYLKLCKAAIEKNDPELALEYVQDVLEADKQNFFAFVFQGKSYQLLNDPDNAIISFKKATNLEHDNLLGWKGYFQSMKMLTQFPEFFQVLTDYVEVLLEQEQPFAEVLKDASNYFKAHDFHSKPELYELYLCHFIPGQKLYDLVGNYFGKGEDNLRKLIDLVMKKEQDMAAKVAFKERMKLPKNPSFEQQKRLNALIEPVYETSKLSTYFDEFLNICNDDELRKLYQEKYFMYSYEKLKVSSEKENGIKQLQQMAEDLVYLKVPSLTIWSLYLDLLDVKSFTDLSKDQILFCINNFPSSGLGKLLYGFVLSDISPFDRLEIQKELNESKKTQIPTKTQEEEEDDEDDDELELLQQVEEDENTSDFSPEHIISFLKDGYSDCKSSVIASRIIINYFIHFREYLEASEMCRSGIKMLADLQRSIGADLTNSREDLICSLAVVYTYHEAPKNFSRALELYERILEDNKSNKRARIGKGLILMEKGNLPIAKELLLEVYAEYSDDPDTLMELGWCEVRMGNREAGRQLLERSLPLLRGSDLQTSELRAKIHWRMAQSYLTKDFDVYDDSIAINVPYDLLILSLKNYSNFAPLYTSLGVIYMRHYQDKVRAQKCFFKAFELDVSQVISAHYLVKDMTQKNEWDVAEILCVKIINSESARRALSQEQGDDAAWPYRVLGCSALNKQDDAKAVEWFQTALRMTSMDFECWVGLGEAYYHCGKLDAAQKVFERALTINQDSWHVMYLLGKVLSDMKEYELGIDNLQKALLLRPNEECIVNALFLAKLDHAQKLLSTGYFGRVLDCNNDALELIKQCSLINNKAQSLWLALYKCLEIFLKVQVDIEKFPMEQITMIFETLDPIVQYSDSLLNEMDELDGKIDLNWCKDKHENGKYTDGISGLIVYTFKRCIDLFPNQGRYMRSVNYYNLGLAYYNCYNLNNNYEGTRSSSIKCFKKAIQLEGKNPNFWVGLGNAYSSFSPQISQHCFIKATALESRDGEIWNNLAALYLKYGDVELAQEAFLRSQSVAPESSQAWLGHAMAAKAQEDTVKASNLFTHAYILSNGRSPIAQLLYALSVLNTRIGSSSPSDISTAQEFGIANFAIQNYLKFYPNDKMGLKIALTISERCKTFELSKQIGEKLLNKLEAEYEETESEVVLEEFINAKAQVARIYLAVNDYNRAIEESEAVLGLAEDSSKQQLSARITIGLSYFFLDDMEKSVDQLKIILYDHNQDAWIVTLTAQILNAFATDITQQAAMDQLFSFIEDNETSLVIVLTLGAICLKNNVEEVLPAIKDELNGLPLTEIVNDVRKYVPRLLEEINSKINVDSKVWERNAILFPQDYNVWKHINSEMALKVAQLEDTKMNSFDMSGAYANNGGLRDIQRSIILAPHNQDAWYKLEAIENK